LLAASVLNTVNAGLAIYLFFLLGWGINYDKPPLRESWSLKNDWGHLTLEQKKANDLAQVTAFNQFLAQRLNSTVSQYRALPFYDIHSRAKQWYRTYTDSKVKEYGLSLKPTLFAFFMKRISVEGYYNPFTGEGQVDKSLPAFIMPFLVCHEMAHQAGIAAEGDANLVAYAVSTATNDPVFNYSAYLNIWLYANARLYYRDSVTAKQIESQLNPLTRAQIDTLDELARKYHTEMSRISTDIFDSYLHMQNQKEGIKSYGNVTSLAWLLEQRRSNGSTRMISIP
jgi:hypothetical protein